MARSNDEVIAAFAAKVAKFKAKHDEAVARKRQQERKFETRRKIILGGLVLADAERDPAQAAYLCGQVARLTRPADRKAFEGWTPPQPPASSQAKPSNPTPPEEANGQDES